MKLYTPILITAGFFISSFAMTAPPADDLLAGPTIEEEEVSDSDMLNRRLQETGKTQSLGIRQQAKMWTTALRSLALTDSQAVAIKNIMDELQKEQRAFQSKYGEELKTIRKQQSTMKNEGKVASSDSKKRMIELGEMTPDIISYQEKAWVLLSAEQQALFQTKYQTLIEEDKKLQLERKNKDVPMMDEKQNRGFAPKDSQFRDKKDSVRGDIINRHGDSVDEGALRRIKFLRRLQQLQKDK